jgi:predicted alpha/beta superfamily hydrolase
MVDFPRATIPETIVRTITSRQVDQDFRISVALPYSYASQPARTYPTIYLLDANVYFGMVTELTRIMAVNGELPQTIVVGIGYPMDEPLQEVLMPFMILRIRDFTPVVDSRWEKELEEDWGRKVPTGGASQFLAFLENELIPLIEEDYRSASDRRVLAGHSLGGLFVLYTLFHRANLFSAYSAGSPALQRGNAITFDYASTFAKQNNRAPARLYVGIGEREQAPASATLSDMLHLASLLESDSQQGFILTKHIIPNCGHAAATAPTFQAGLQAVLTD